jgi:hypothetical protein
MPRQARSQALRVPHPEWQGNPLPVVREPAHTRKVKRIQYACADFLTNDAIADALMDYASVLAIVDSSDVVECEGVDEKGKVRRYQLLIGPASQIISVPTDDEDAEMDVKVWVDDFRRRARYRLPSSTDVGDSDQQPIETDAEATSHESN